MSQAYWRATHPPERTQPQAPNTAVSRNIPSQEVSPTGDAERERMGPPGMNVPLIYYQLQPFRLAFHYILFYHRKYRAEDFLVITLHLKSPSLAR